MRRGALVVLLVALAAAGAWWVLDPHAATDGGGADQPLQEGGERQGPTLVGLARSVDDAASARARAARDGRPPPEERPWRLYGTVSRSDGGPAAGANVQATFEAGTALRAVGGTVALEDGAYVVDLSALAADTKAQLEVGTLWIDAWLPTVGMTRESVPLGGRSPTLAADGLWCNLVLGSEVPLRGRVVAASGRPVANVQLYVQGTRVAGRDLPRTGPDGRFVLARLQGQPRTLCAFAPEVGGGSQDLGAASDTGELPDLVLRAMPSVAGHVSFADGSPVAGARVTVEGEGEVDACARPWMRVATLSGPDGRFRVFLPVEGPCEVTVPGAADVAASTGVEDLAIVVALSRVRLRVRTPEGLPVVEAHIGTRHWLPAYAQALDDMLSGRIDAEAANRSSTTGMVTTDTEGRADVYVARGSALALLAGGREHFLEHHLRAPTSDNDVEVDLSTRVLGPPGGLEVTWKAPDGRAVARARATLRTSLGRELGTAVGPAPLRLAEVPSGRHVLALIREAGEDRNERDPHHWIHDQRVPVDVEAGATRAVDVEARFGGGLHLMLQAPPAPELPGRPVREAEPRSYLARAVAPEEPYGVPLHLGWTGHHVTRGWSQPHVFPPGRWRVQVIAKGGDWTAPLLEAEVEIRPREVTEFRLALPR